jgi:hypothetical protein
MAGGIAYREENRSILSFGFLKSFITPWIPINRIVGMLEEIGGFFLS